MKVIKYLVFSIFLLSSSGCVSFVKGVLDGIGRVDASIRDGLDKLDGNKNYRSNVSFYTCEVENNQCVESRGRILRHHKYLVINAALDNSYISYLYNRGGDSIYAVKKITKDSVNDFIFALDGFIKLNDCTNPKYKEINETLKKYELSLYKYNNELFITKFYSSSIPAKILNPTDTDTFILLDKENVKNMELELRMWKEKDNQK